MLIRVQHAQALPDNRWRLAAIFGVLLIHLLIIALIFSGIPKIFSQRATPREIFFIFAPKSPERFSPVPVAPARPAYIPGPRAWSFSPKANIAPAPQIKGLGLSLLRCAPENLANLSPEELVRCSSSARLGPFWAPDDANPGIVKEHAVAAGMWQASIAQRNTPLAAPCSTLRAIPEDVTTGRTANVIIVDPVCTLRLLKNAGP